MQANDKVPVHETLEMVQYAKLHGVRLVGPNSAGVVSPGKASAAELNEDQLPLVPGSIGLLSKSGSLSYEVIDMIHAAGFGCSTVICIGRRPCFGYHPGGRAAGLLPGPGDQGGAAAGGDWRHRRDRLRKAHCPDGQAGGGLHQRPLRPGPKEGGHAGAIIGGQDEPAAAKTEALQQAGAHMVLRIEDIAKRLTFLGL